MSIAEPRAPGKYIEARYQLRVRFGSPSGSLEIEATDLNSSERCEAELIYGKDDVAQPKASSATTDKIEHSTEPQTADLGVRTRKMPSPQSSESSAKNSLDDALRKRDIRGIKSVLEREYQNLTKGDMPWLTETVALGYSMDDIAEVLLEEHEVGSFSGIICYISMGQMIPTRLGYDFRHISAARVSKMLLNWLLSQNSHPTQAGNNAGPPYHQFTHEYLC